MRNVIFRGIRPNTMDDSLDNSYAAYASNCMLYGGAIRPLRSPVYLQQAVDVYNKPVRSVATLHAADSLLVGFSTPTFVAPDPILAAGRGSFLFVKNSKLYRSGPTWVIDGLGPVEVGICPPTATPSVSKTGVRCSETFDMTLDSCIEDVMTLDCQDDIQVLSFVYTYVTACGEESAPSLPSDLHQLRTLDQLRLTPNDTPPENAITRRWYVAIDTDKQPQWFFIGEHSIEETYFDYCHSVYSFNEILTTEDYNPPPACIDGVAAIGTASIAVWQGRDVWFSEPNQPHAFPDRMRQTLEDDIKAIITLTDQSLGNGVVYAGVVLTDGQPYVIRGSLPEEMEFVRLNRIAPCLNPYGAIAAQGSVFYPSDDGIIRIVDQSCYSVTSDWFTRQEWQDMKPGSMMLGYYNDRLFAFNTVCDGLMIRYPSENNQYQQDCVYITSRYDAVHTTRTGQLLCSSEGAVYEWEAGATRLMATWRSKLYTQSGLWKPTSAKVICDIHEFANGEARQAADFMAKVADGCVDGFVQRYPEYLRHYSYLVSQAVRFSLYADNELVYQRYVKSQKPFRLRRDRRRIYWSYQVDTQADIRELHVQTSMDDLTQEGGHA